MRSRARRASRSSRGRCASRRSCCTSCRAGSTTAHSKRRRASRERWTPTTSRTPRSSAMRAAPAVDAAGVAHAPAGASARIVSLVPSITELLFALGLDRQIVGRTGFCVHPRERVRHVPKVGGTKAVNVDAIRALQPTHVIVNIDENERDTVGRLRSFVPHIVGTHPQTPHDNLALYAL